MSNFNHQDYDHYNYTDFLDYDENIDDYFNIENSQNADNSQHANNSQNDTDRIQLVYDINNCMKNLQEQFFKNKTNAGPYFRYSRTSRWRIKRRILEQLNKFNKTFVRQFGKI
jgi:hypothetical protein